MTVLFVAPCDRCGALARWQQDGDGVKVSPADFRVTCNCEETT